LYQGLITNRNV